MDRKELVAIVGIFAVVFTMVGLLMLAIYLVQTRDTEQNVAREYQCAKLCIPHAVLVCPIEARPVCQTHEPWPATFVAGEKPTDKPWDASKYEK
jgi:hypothetical protein